MANLLQQSQKVVPNCKDVRKGKKTAISLDHNLGQSLLAVWKISCQFCQSFQLATTKKSNKQLLWLVSFSAQCRYCYLNQEVNPTAWYIANMGVASRGARSAPFSYQGYSSMCILRAPTSKNRRPQTTFPIPNQLKTPTSKPNQDPTPKPKAPNHRKWEYRRIKYKC